jgi:hypothetical protein
MGINPMKEEAYYNVVSAGPGYRRLTVYAENWQTVLDATMPEKELQENISLLERAGAVPAAKASVQQAFGLGET